MNAKTPSPRKRGFCYPILQPYLISHSISNVIDSSPPIFMAVDKASVARVTGSWNQEGEAFDKALLLVQQRSLRVIQGAWALIHPEIQREVLAAWAVDWTRDTKFVSSLKRPAAVVEVVQDVNKKTSTSQVGANITLHANFQYPFFDDDSEIADTDHFDLVTGLVSTFESFAQMFRQQHPSSPCWNGYHISPEDYDEISLFEDFPLVLNIRRQVLREYPHFANKAKRAFKFAVNSMSPEEQSSIFGLFSSCWSYDKWGQQDPNPGGRIVIAPSFTSYSAYLGDVYDWLPYPRVIEINEEMALEDPEPELMSTLRWALLGKNFGFVHEDKPLPMLNKHFQRVAESLWGDKPRPFDCEME